MCVCRCVYNGPKFEWMLRRPLGRAGFIYSGPISNLSLPNERALFLSRWSGQPTKEARRLDTAPYNGALTTKCSNQRPSASCSLSMPDCIESYYWRPACLPVLGRTCRPKPGRRSKRKCWRGCVVAVGSAKREIGATSR